MRKSFLIAGGLAALITAYMVFVIPLSEKRPSMKESIEIKYATLKKYEGFVKGALVTEKELKEAKKELEEMEKGIIGATDESLAFANFQLKAQDIAQKAGLRVTSVRPKPSQKNNGYRSLPIFIEARSDIKGLSDFLRALDSEDIFVRMETLNVQVSDTRSEKELRIKMQISGLMKS